MAVYVAAQPGATAGESKAGAPCAAAERALAIWPRLDRRALSRRSCDKQRLARYISRRTSLPLRSIEALLDRS